MFMSVLNMHKNHEKKTPIRERGKFPRVWEGEFPPKKGEISCSECDFLFNIFGKAQKVEFV